MPDVAGHAAHPRVGRRQVRGVLRLHHGVAQGAAEGDGLAVQEGVVRDEGHEDGEERSSEGDVDEPLPVPRDVQVDEGIREGIFASHPAPAHALVPHPVQEDGGAHGEERREHHVGEDADVGTGLLGADLEREREDDEEDASPEMIAPTRLTAFRYKPPRRGASSSDMLSSPVQDKVLALKRLQVCGRFGKRNLISVLIFRGRVAKMIFLQYAEGVELADTPS